MNKAVKWALGAVAAVGAAIVGYQAMPTSTVTDNQSLSALVAAHSVTIHCTASVSPGVTGYNVYRDGLKVNAALLPTCDYSDTNVTEGATYRYTVRAVAPSNTTPESVDSNQVSATIPGAPPPPPPPPPTGTSSLWTATDKPAVVTGNDPASIEAGLRWSSSAAGTVTALKFYKASNSTGTHTGHLWGPIGTLLASCTYANETASGWQQCTIPATTISVGAVYTVSYHTARYAASAGYFAMPRVVGPLTGIGAVHLYGTAVAFPPVSSLETDNLWADVVFTSGTTPPPPPMPTLTIDCTKAKTAFTGTGILPGTPLTISGSISGAAPVMCIASLP